MSRDTINNNKRMDNNKREPPRYHRQYDNNTSYNMGQIDGKITGIMMELRDIKKEINNIGL